MYVCDDGVMILRDKCRTCRHDRRMCSYWQDVISMPFAWCFPTEGTTTATAAAVEINLFSFFGWRKGDEATSILDGMNKLLCRKFESFAQQAWSVVWRISLVMLVSIRCGLPVAGRCCLSVKWWKYTFFLTSQQTGLFLFFQTLFSGFMTDDDVMWVLNKSR